MSNDIVKCNGTGCKIWGNMDTNLFLSDLKKIDSTAWTRYDFRKAPSNQHTCTIPLVFQTHNWKRSEPVLIHRFLEFSHLFPWIERLQQYVTGNGMEEGIVIKAMIVMLKPHSSITPHTDSTDGLLLSHRCHWVVQSDPSVQFMVNNTTTHWPETYIYELNNTMIHGVENPSDQPRLHFIFDILPTRYLTNGVTYRDFTAEEYKQNEQAFLSKQNFPQFK